MTQSYPDAIQSYFDTQAPADIRAVLDRASKGTIVNAAFPYDARLKRSVYEREIAALQIELVKFQTWVKDTNQRIAVVFEGRDAAGKGGTIKRFRENLNPRSARVVALSKPNDREAGEWYFQRYVRTLPSAGEITFLDRSWYNRGVVEH
ncbi:MAG: polyphosphate kinase 2, partial [Pseudomonadota bacterium]